MRAIKTKTFALRIKLNKECFIPREEGRTVRNNPKIKIGFDRA